MVVIIDYNCGNLMSVQKAFNRLNIANTISADHEVIRKADKLVLPGVGHFGHGMQKLEEHGLIPVIKEFVNDSDKPLLGICLGMQLLMDFSEESNSHGLGLIEGTVRKFQFEENRYSVPHMGWNNCLVRNEKNPFFISDENEFYFVHSYFVQCKNREFSLGTSSYGSQLFDSHVGRANIFGVQFHPEKSFNAGLNILKKFSELDV